MILLPVAIRSNHLHFLVRTQHPCLGRCSQREWASAKVYSRLEQRQLLGCGFACKDWEMVASNRDAFQRSVDAQSDRETTNNIVAVKGSADVVFDAQVRELALDSADRRKDGIKSRV